MNVDPPAVIEIAPVIEAEAEYRASVRSEFAFVKKQLADIKATLDLLLKAMDVDDDG